MFKIGHRPIWEDYCLGQNGGIFQVKLPKSLGKKLDLVWENVLLALIGESFNDSQISGAMLSTRKGRDDVIQLWCTGNRRLLTAAKLVQVMDLPFDVIVYYKDYFKCIRDRASFNNSDAFKFEKATEDMHNTEKPQVTMSLSIQDDKNVKK